MSNTTIVGPHSGSKVTLLAFATAKGAKRLDQVELFFDELFAQSLFDGFMIGVQSAEETGNWTSDYWSVFLNPGGLGITFSGQASRTWATGRDAARAMLIHHCAYTGTPVPSEWQPWIPLDFRYQAVKDAGFYGKVKTWSNYGDGYWAEDPLYFEKIMDREQEIRTLETTTATYIFGNVPHPPFVDQYVPDSKTGAWDDLGQRVPVGVCQHSMVGTLDGTNSWFRRGIGVSTGLTDYGIGGSSDGANDGVIYRWNDPRGRRSGWANGGSDGLEGDGPLYVRTFGVNGINRNLVSIERSDGGNTNQPMSPKQFNAIVALTAHWFDQAKVPWDKYPLNPAFSCVTHLIHNEFATKDCPFPPVYNHINDIQNSVRAILKAAQTKQVAQPPVSPPPVSPPPIIEVPTPVPPVTPVEPNHAWWPAAYTEEGLKTRFSDVIRHNYDGTTEQLWFDADSAVINAWVARGAAEQIPMNELPVPDDWFVMVSKFTPRRDFVTFDQGRWELLRRAGNAGWTWTR